MNAAVVVLYRPVGPRELELIGATGWKRFPPRVPEQPIFYPVENEAYARQIARDWNVRSSGSGFVLRFSVEALFMTKYPLQQVGGAVHREYWIPAEELEDLNDHIVSQIELVDAFGNVATG